MKTALVVVALLTACASLPQGVAMTDEDRAACAAQGCSVWTLEELKKLIFISAQRGFLEGQKRKGELSL